MADEGHIFYAGPMAPDILIRFGGTFPSSTDEEIMASFCAWYFVRCAHLSILELEGQATLEGEIDITTSLRRIIDSLLPVYGMQESEIEKVMNLMPLCRAEAFRRKLKWNDKFQAWLDSGGRAYDEVTRNPDAI